MHLIMFYNYFPPLLYSFGFIQMFGYLPVLITIPLDSMWSHVPSIRFPFPFLYVIF